MLNKTLNFFTRIHLNFKLIKIIFELKNID